MDTKTERAVYTIPDTNHAYLMAQITKLNKRCAKLGIPAIGTTSELDHTRHEYRLYSATADKDFFRWFAEVDLHTVPTGATATGKVMEMFEVTITGTAPKYAGWRFIATLEPLPGADDKTETLNLIMTVPGEKCPVSYMAAAHVGRCDHCNAKRVRKQTFVVQHDDGTFKAVGRQCIKDFLGHDDPNKLAAWAELLIELGGMAAGACDDDWLGGMGGNAESRYDLEFYLGWVAGVVRHLGWMSRSRAKAIFKPGEATVDHVNYILSPPVKMDDKERREYEALKAECTPTDNDKTTAAVALEWALGLDIEALMAAGGADNYLANVAALARARTVTRKTCGLGGSIVAAYARACQKELNEKQLANRPASVHVGTVKARAVYRVRCDRVIPHESDFGCTYITRMTIWDDTRAVYANDAVWFASSNHDMAEGKFYSVKMTVKKHEDYNGRPQTVFTRGAVVKGLYE